MFYDFIRNEVAPADICDTGDSVVICIDLPGVKKEDIDIKVDNGVLNLKASRPEPQGKFTRAERLFGTFQRSFKLSRYLDSERISASYENGVLELKIPRSEAAKPKQIAVN